MTTIALDIRPMFLNRLMATFAGRRLELEAIATATVVTGRWFVRYPVVVSQPSMASNASMWSKPRTQPRDRRGRFLSRAWLDNAEAFTTTDLAWFRLPVKV